MCQRRCVRSLARVALAIAVVARPAAAHDPEPANAIETTEQSEQAPEVTIHGERLAGEAASRTHVTYRELQLRPQREVGDLLEAVPGLFAVQHAGGGKANQWFLRGFDADHGTDVAFFVDGVPVNFVSHAHGQGYSDFHFLIPELVVGVDAYKGPYYAELGDFATAGAVSVSLAEALPESRVTGAYGQYGIRRGLAIAAPTIDESSRAVLAAEVAADDGPFQNPERLRRFNLFARLTHDFSAAAKLSLTWMSYGSTWHGSGQIPARAVCGEGEVGTSPPEASGAACIDHFGTVDPSEGGATQRHQLSLRYANRSSQGELEALLYWVRYRFTLYSNFTFFAEDPLRGDEIEQDDDRNVVGADFHFARVLSYRSLRVKTSVGLQARVDSIDNALWHDQARERLEPRVGADVAETELGLYAKADARLTESLRFIAGLRADRIDVAVDDRLEDRSTSGTRSSGTKGAVLLSPKLLAVFSPLPVLDVFASYGRGFHSNDARGAVLDRNAATLITPALGYELGARLSPRRDWSLEASAFLIDLASELVWSGDTGATEPAGRTRRYGVEIGARYRIANWLFADADATFVHARFRENAGNGSAVALAPTRTFSAGIAARPTFGALTPFAALHIKSLADRPATEDGSLIAQGFTVVDANVGARYRDVQLSIDVQNLFDQRYREVNFANESRLAYEPAPVEGIHYSPGWPRTIMARASLYWR